MIYKINIYKFCRFHTLIPYFCLMAILKDKATGAINRGTPPRDSAAGVQRSHSGSKGLSPSCFEMLQAKQGQHQKA